MTSRRMANVQQFVGRQIPERLSPVGGWLGGTLLRLAEGELAASFVVRRDMTNPSGILHGGIMATMLDELMGFTVFLLDDESFFASINLTIDFLASARLGDKVVFGATVDLADEETGEEKRYQIVGDLEADIKQGLISISSPVARALIGKHEGDSVRIAAPGGERAYEIVAVIYEG